MATPPEARPAVTDDVHTVDLPRPAATRLDDPGDPWAEAPAELRALGADFGVHLVAYKRRIGRFLLWRAGPASREDARYMALASDDLGERYSFRLYPDGRGDGVGADGGTHTRLRTWKESLRDAS